MKKCLISIIVIIFLVSCGVPKEEFAKLEKDVEYLKKEVDEISKKIDLMESFGVFSELERATQTDKSMRTMQDMRSIGEAVEIYQIDFNVYPDTIDQLHPDYMKNPPKFDAWDNEYVYKVSSNKKNYELISKGADGKLNTEDDIVFSDGQFTKYPK